MTFVIFNAYGIQNVKGPRVGERMDFICWHDGDRIFAWGFGPRLAWKFAVGSMLGWPVPAFVARLMGWDVERYEDGHLALWGHRSGDYTAANLVPVVR